MRRFFARIFDALSCHGYIRVPESRSVRERRLVRVIVGQPFLSADDLRSRFERLRCLRLTD